MAISKRSHSTGAAGGNGMSQVSDEEIKRSFEETGIKDTPKARKQKQRLGKFFKEYWDCIECSCGHCGMVYRFPKQNEAGETFTTADYDRVDFTNTTLKNKCPSCIGAQIQSNEKTIIRYEELELLKLPRAVYPTEPPDNITK